MRQHGGADETQRHQREVLGRPELQRELRKRHGHGRHQNGRDAAREKRSDRRDRKRGAGFAFARHLIAVETGHRRGCLAGHVDEDRRRRAAVLRTVEDPCQHDQRGDRLKCVRCRQQHRDRRDRADAREHADQRAEQAADEGV